VESKIVGVTVLSILRAIAWIYYLLPVRVSAFWARSLGAFLRVSGLRAKVVRENLLIAFPGKTPGDVQKREQLFREAYTHLGYLVFEVMMVLGPMKRYGAAKVEIRGLQHWRKAGADGRARIFLSSHVGCWEVMGCAGALAGVPILFVTKHLKPEWLHRAIEKGRARCNVSGTYEPRTLRDVMRHFKNGGTVGFVLDQFAGAPVGVRVPLFGVPVGTHLAVAAVAKRMNAIVLPVVNYRIPGGKFIIEISPPLDWIGHPDPDHELAANTAHYAATLERHIRAHPEQWLWIHRRFKGDMSPLREGEWSSGRKKQA